MSAQPVVAPERRDVYGRPRPALGNPAPLACTVAMAAVTAVHGGEGLERAWRWLAPEVLEQLERQRSLARRAGRRGAAVAVQRARVCRVTRDAAEVAIVAVVDGRAHAVAMRLEDNGGRWLVAALEIG